MTAITLTNIGPIAALSIPIPPDGGVVVLQGRNGSGKSTALDAVQSAVSGKGKPPLKDLAKSGEVNAAGVRLTVAKSVRRSGELEVATLEGRLSVADLVDPGILDPARADATRIKALVGLSGAPLKEGDLCGFPPEMLDGLELSDPVAAMADLKRRLDIGGREHEKLAKAEADKAAALLEAAGDPIEGALAHDPQAMVTEAIRRLDRLSEAKRAADVATQRAEEATTRLDALPVVSVGRETGVVLELSNAVSRFENEARMFKEKYNAAVAAYKEASANLETAKVKLEAAKQQEVLRDQLIEQIKSSVVHTPDAQEIADAQAALDAAQTAVQAEAVRQQALQAKAQGRAHAAEADRLATEAALWRRKAKQTDEVLTEIVSEIPGCPLKINDGRLVIPTQRGPTYFAELSHGERWRIALDIAIGAIGDNGLLVIPQEAWEGLDPANRSAIAAQAKASCAVILTAECSNDALVARSH